MILFYWNVRVPFLLRTDGITLVKVTVVRINWQICTTVGIVTLVPDSAPI